MGTVKKDYQRKTYYLLTAGKVRQRVKENTPGSEVREVKIPNSDEVSIKHELVFDGIKGFITAISINTEGKYDDTLDITMRDETSEFMVVSTWKTGYARRIIQRLPNVDFAEEVYIEPYDFESDDGVQRVGANVFQDGQKIDSFYHELTADKKVTGLLHGLPMYDEQLIAQDRDELVLYKAAMSKFMKKEIAERIIPALHQTNIDRTPEVQAGQEPIQEQVGQEPALEINPGASAGPPRKAPELLPEDDDSGLPF